MNYDEKQKIQSLAQKYGNMLKEKKEQLEKKYSRDICSFFSSIFTLNSSVSRHLKRFLNDKNKLPSEFINKHMPYLSDFVSEKHIPIILHYADHIRDYGYTTFISRRSFRDEYYLSYANVISFMICDFSYEYCADAPLIDCLTGNLNEEMSAFYRSRWHSCYNHWQIAYALDNHDAEVEKEIYEIVTEENGNGRFNHAIIKGILYSHRNDFHVLLGKLLLAAKLQEGLRQSICECADLGTREAFIEILNVIKDNGLIRYSSIKRAVGTWTGIMSSEERDIDRVSEKNVSLILECINNEPKRREYLATEDALKIHTALWAYGTESIRKSLCEINNIIENGTKHSILCAGYFESNLCSDFIDNATIKKVLNSNIENHDVIAIWLNSFFYERYEYMSKEKISSAKIYFEGDKEISEFFDIMLKIHSQISEKTKTFSPCVFPWFEAKLSKSKVAENLCFLAAISDDREKKDIACSFIKETDSGQRYRYFEILLHSPRTELQRKTLLEGLADKEYYTRQTAFDLVSKLSLTKDEYLFIEDFLRFKNEQIKENVISLLLKQGDMEECISRLLSSEVQEKRLGGLDILIRLKKDEKQKDTQSKLISLLTELSEKATDKEKLIIETLLPKKEYLNSELERIQNCEEYKPLCNNKEYAERCIHTFMRYFPDSSLCTLINEKPKSESASSGSLLSKVKSLITKEAPSDSCIQAAIDISSLLKFFEENKKTEVKSIYGETVFLDSLLERGLINIRDEYIGCELWDKWANQFGITFERMLRAYILLFATENKTVFFKNSEKHISFLYGKGFGCGKNLPLKHSLGRVLKYLISKIPQKHLSELASAVCLWFIRNVEDKDVMLENKPSVEGAPKKAHMLADPQIYSIFKHTNSYKEDFEFSFPLAFAVCKRCREAAKDIPKEITVKYKYFYSCLRFDYQTSLLCPEDENFDLRCNPLPIYGKDYIFALHHGLMTKEQALYHILRSPSTFEILSVSKSYMVENGKNVISRRFNYNFQRVFEDFLGRSTSFDENDNALISLSAQLYDILIPIIVEKEIRRGEGDTEFTPIIPHIKCLYGASNLSKILSALGNDTLSRNVGGWHSPNTRKECLSHLLAVSLPSNEDTPLTLKTSLNDKIKPKRLIETAIYANGWIKIIGEYLGIQNLESICYYFMAHTSEKYDDRTWSLITRYTPLSPQELMEGVFDVTWFREAYASVSPKQFDMVYDAAKYISDGAKHMRARKYADAASGKYSVSETEKEISEKRNKDLLMSYALIPIVDENDVFRRYLFLQNFKKESKKFGSQRMTSEGKAVNVAITNLAINAGYSDSMRLILRMEMKTAEENKELFEGIVIDGISLRLMIAEEGKADIAVSRDGKPLKSIPASIKKDERVLLLQNGKKLLKEQYSRTRIMLEEAMEEQTAFTFKEIRELSAHPVVSFLIKDLVFKSESNKCGFVFKDGLLSFDKTVTPLSDADVITIAHPYTLFELELWTEYQKYLFDNEIKQPIRQVFRELYVKTAEEAESFNSLRYAGNQIQPAKTISVLKSRRWTPSIESGIQKIYYKENIVAEIFALADWFTPADIECPTIEYVSFTHRKTGEEIKISEIPPIIFSEVMRDVDLAVSVAHAGGVDPKASHSTIDMRKAVFSFLLPMLKITNVELKEKNAYIKGTLADYSINLGSGVIHQIGGAMIPVLPVHSQHKGKLFLPFIDDDPKTAEILSKIILFSKDEKIKDPSILSCIMR